MKKYLLLLFTLMLAITFVPVIGFTNNESIPDFSIELTKKKKKDKEKPKDEEPKDSKSEDSKEKKEDKKGDFNQGDKD